MKKGLVICSTPYQIMVAGILRKQCFEIEDSVDMILTNTFASADVIVESIKETGCYRNVKLINVKNLIVPSNMCEKIYKIGHIIAPCKTIKKWIGKEIEDYDSIYFNCEDIVAYSLIAFFRNRNPRCKVFRFEEGYSSYTEKETSSPKSKILISIRYIFKGGSRLLNLDGAYYFEPNLLIHEYDYSIFKIDRSIINDDYRSFIKKVFNTGDAASTYKCPVIIFEESFVHDGFNIDDLCLYEKVIKELKSENISVKLHPRTQVDRFSKYGVDVHSPDGIPWEAILLSGVLEDRVLVALASGSIINSRLLLGDGTLACLLYKCLEHRPAALTKNFERFLDNFINEYNNEIFIPNSYDEFIVFLKSALKENRRRFNE